MSNFKPVVTISGLLSGIPVSDGQLITVYDTKEIYVDKGNERIKYSDVIADTYSNITGLTAPLADKIYFATDTHQLLQATYSGSSVTWTELVGGGSSTLAGLTDVTISSPTSGQALVYNGSGWVNGITTGSGGTKVVTKDGNTSLQAVTNLTPSYPGSTRGHGAVDLQQYRPSNFEVASGDYSVAMGLGNRADGYCSIAMGIYNFTGAYSVALGDSNHVNRSSVAFGSMNESRGLGDTLIGDYNYSDVGGSLFLGISNQSYGSSTLAIGYDNRVIQDYSIAIGVNNKAGRRYAVAIGDSNRALGEHAVAIGEEVVATGKNSTVFGCKATNTVPGVVCNNTYIDYNNPEFLNTSGNCGFKGIRVTGLSIIPLWNLGLTDKLIATIHVTAIDRNKFSRIQKIVVEDCELVLNQKEYAGDYAEIWEFNISDGRLELYTFDPYIELQIGIFYTLASQTGAMGSSSSSSSSDSGSGSEDNGSYDSYDDSY